MEEERSITTQEINQKSSICKCFLENKPEIRLVQKTKRREKVFNIVSSTETYLKERRIPELIRFLLTKVLAEAPDKPVAFLEKLMDDCMLFRAGYGLAPTLYETRHLQAIITSYDPGRRGWLSAEQVRRLYSSFGLNAENIVGDTVSVELVLENLKKTQEIALYQLLSAGIVKNNCTSY